MIPYSRCKISSARSVILYSIRCKVECIINETKSISASAGIAFDILDVRFPPEFRHGHIDGASNVPVVVLRKRLRELDRDKTYLVTPEGGRRSELAVYLLRQAGLNVYLLNT